MSKQVDYALQLMHALSLLKKDTYLSLRTFARESNISFLFLQRIVRSLKKAGLIDATRGMRGGYYCIVDPKRIDLKTFIEIVDGPFGIADCLRGSECPRKKMCTAYPFFVKLNKNIEELFKHTYILD